MFSRGGQGVPTLGLDQREMVDETPHDRECQLVATHAFTPSVETKNGQTRVVRIDTPQASQYCDIPGAPISNITWRV
jgi:hypothetical protein